MTKENKETAAFVNIQDFESLCKSVDEEIAEKMAGCFAQRRTLVKALSYADALSDPLSRNKTSWGIAEGQGYENPGAIQALVGENKWDSQDVWDRIAILASELENVENDPLGIGIIADETAQEKRGDQTAGVGYQYAGIAGKVVNCTTWVSLALAGPHYKTWVSSTLYLPKKDWFTGRKERGEARRRKAGIPLGTRFMTKPRIARKSYQNLRDIGVNFTWGGGDEVYGRYAKLREDHEKNGEAYAYFIPRNFKVTTPSGQRKMVSELPELKEAKFEERSAGPGVNGPRYYEWAMIGIKSPDHYLLIRRPAREWPDENDQKTGAAGPERGMRTTGKSGGGKSEGKRQEEASAAQGMTFCLCYVPPESAIKPTMTNLVLMAGRRWGIEESNAVEKGPVGWDENQFRQWKSLCRHTALAGLAALRANTLIRALEKIETGEEIIPVKPENAHEAAGEAPAEEEPEFVPHDLMIPLGDSITPDEPGQEMPDRIGFIRISVAEVLRLREIAVSGISDARKAFHLRWSKWRRKHQATARWHHQIGRLRRNSNTYSII